MRAASHTPYKNKLLGFSLLAVTMTIAFLEWKYIVDLFYFLLNVTPWKLLNWLIIAMVFIILFLINIALGKLVYLGRAYIANDGEKVYQKAIKNKMPITLYLRSFESEKRKGIANEWEDIIFATINNGMGKFIGFGIPKEKVQTIGADRIYVKPNEDWKEKIIKLIKKSNLIIIDIALTEGLIWEIREVIKNNEPEKLLLYSVKYQNDDKFTVYNEFRNATKDIFPKPLLEKIPSREKFFFLTFDKEWNSSLLKVKWIENKIQKFKFIKPSDRIKICHLLHKKAVSIDYKISVWGRIHKLIWSIGLFFNTFFNFMFYLMIVGFSIKLFKYLITLTN